MTQTTNGPNPLGEGAANEGGAICRELFGELPQGVFYRGADGALLDINPAGLRVLGCTREELLAGVCADPRWKLVDEQGRDTVAVLVPGVVAAEVAGLKQLVTFGIEPGGVDLETAPPHPVAAHK